MTFESDYSGLLRYASWCINKKNVRLEPADLVNSAYILYVEKGIKYNIGTVKKLIYGLVFQEVNHQIQMLPSSVYKVHFDSDKHCHICKQTKPIGGFYNYRNSIELQYTKSICKDCYLKEKKEYYKQNREECLLRRARYCEKHPERLKLINKKYYVKNKPERVIVEKEKKIRPPKIKSPKIRVVKEKIVKPPKKVLTPEERRLRQLERMRVNYQKKAKNKKPQPIKALWRKANNKYFEKQKEGLTDIYIKSLLKRFGNITPEMIENKRAELLNKRVNENAV